MFLLYTLAKNVFPLTLINESGPNIVEFSIRVKKELAIKQTDIHYFNVISEEQLKKEILQN